MELREELFDSVKNGTKKATLRKGKRDYSVGKILVIGTEKNRAMLCEVLKVNVKTIGQITESDARKEGYETRKELIDIMEDIYGELGDDEVVTQVDFMFHKEYVNR